MPTDRPDSPTGPMPISDAELSPTLDPAQAEDLVRALEASGELDALVLLADGNAPKVVRRAARAALHRVRSSGRNVPEPAREGLPPHRDADAPRPRAYLSPPEPDGASAFLLLYAIPRGYCAIAGMTGGDDGLRDVAHTHVGRSESRLVVRDFEAQERHAVELPFLFVLHHVFIGARRARAITGAEPLEWIHFREHLPPDMRQDAERINPFAGLDPDLTAVPPDDGALLSEYAERWGGADLFPRALPADDRPWSPAGAPVTDAGTLAACRRHLACAIADARVTAELRDALAERLGRAALAAKVAGDDARCRSARRTSLALRDPSLRPSEIDLVVRAIDARLARGVPDPPRADVATSFVDRLDRTLPRVPASDAPADGVVSAPSGGEIPASDEPGAGTHDGERPGRRR